MQKTVGIAGLGTVGAEVARQILKNHTKTLNIVAVCARDKTKDRGVTLPDTVQWFDVAADMIPHCDIVVELMGGTGDNVHAFIHGGLRAEKNVVTANKAYLSNHLSMLENKNLGYEAAVAGGIPVIECVKTSLRGNSISKITAILNGTCNYILTELESNPQPFDAIVKQAQDAGYAEADPTLDISGKDTLQKSMILARLAFGDIPINMHCTGLDDATPDAVKKAQNNGQVIRLVSEISLQNGCANIDVQQKIFDATHDFATATGAQNAVLIEAEPIKSLFLKGYGAGAGPTASAVLADILKFA